MKPSVHGATDPYEPWAPSKDASILLYPQLVSPSLVFLASVMHPSGRRPPLLFLVFILRIFLTNNVGHSEVNN
jgi:hypothetical protein